MFYSDEQYEEYQRDLAGDGYHNEFQRAFAQSQIARPLVNQRAEAAALNAAGKYVVCNEIEVCCSITDGLIGYDFVIVKACDYLHQAEILVAASYDSFIFQPELPGLVEQTAVNDDEIPF